MGAEAVIDEAFIDETVIDVLRAHGLIRVRSMLAAADPGRTRLAQDRPRSRLTPELVARWHLDRMLVADVDPRTDILALGRLLESLPAVAWAGPDHLGQGGAIVPSDSHLDAQWHHHNVAQTGGRWDADIDTDIAWRMATGDATVVVAVLDTGIDSDHPEFAGRLLPGHDFVNNDTDAEDDNGHGTRVSGVLAANGDNGFGVAGVDWNCRLLPVKVLDENNLGATSVLVEGILWAISQGVQVINMSLIDYTDVEPLDAALQAARDAGIILIACAGNGGLGDADVSWPGASAATISVGATNAMDNRSMISGTGKALDVMAPGVNIATVLFDSDADDYDVFRGCSAATPMVAGIASLIKARTPEADHDTVREILIATAHDQVGAVSQDTPGRDDYYGYGRVDAARALLRATAGVRPFNVGRAGTEAVVPTLSVSAEPRLGSADLALAIDEGLGAARATLVIGLDRLMAPVHGSGFLVGQPVLVLDLVLTGDPGQPASGSAELGPFEIPDDPGLAGLLFMLQAVVFDPAATGGIAWTDAVELTLLGHGVND